MKGLKGFSIRQKIIFIILAVTVISIVTGLTIEIFSNKKASRKELTDNITLDAKLIADYLVPTFLFDDKKGAEEILLKLANIPAVIYGAAYVPSGALYAEYKSYLLVDSTNTVTEILKSDKNADKIIVREPVKWKNEVLGTVLMISSMILYRKKQKVT